GGTYLPTHPADNLNTIDINNQKNAFVLKMDVKIYGGFAGTETSLLERDLMKTTNASILSGNLGDQHSNTDNSFHVVISAGAVGTGELNGFTIKEGNASGGGTNIMISTISIDPGNGGGICSYSSSPTLTNIIASGNNGQLGGGMYNESSSPVLTNLIVSGNTSNAGGAFYNLSSSPILNNITISGNYANNGGGISNNNSLPKIRNTIIYGNSDGIFNEDPIVSIPEITYSLVQGLTDESNGNISGDKYIGFVSPLSPGLSTGGDYHLMIGSYALNSGNNAYFDADSIPNLSSTTTDIDGFPRIHYYNIDLGAFEGIRIFPTNGIAYVKESTGVGNYDGSSWNNATNDLQAAIDAPGVRQVWVAIGTYRPTNFVPNETPSFTLKNGVGVYGGFSTTGNPSFEDRNWQDGNTTLMSFGNAIIKNNFSSTNPLLNSAVLDGFKIINCYNPGGKGGGIYNNYASPTLTHLILYSNEAAFGGGIYNDNSNPIITNVLLYINAVEVSGGGMYNDHSSPILTNVTISANNASLGGGMFNTNSSNPEIRNTIIYGNSQGILNNDIASLPVILYSLVQGLSDTSNGNLPGSTDPDFIFMDKFSDAPGGSYYGGDYRLVPGSSASNKGNKAYFDAGAVPDLSAIEGDLNKFIRIKGIIDLGPYETSSKPLSVNLINYTAEIEGTRSKLKWITAAESQNKEFIITRSPDGLNYTEIGRVTGKGNISSQNSYVYYDESPVSGTNFYRLEQLSYNGEKADLGVRTVHFSLVVKNFMRIYPNPIKNSVMVEFTSKMYNQLELTDVNGKVLQRFSLMSTDSKKNIIVDNLSAGIYFIKLIGIDKVESRKVVKE
ncbi:MAG: T9SS type A sorting domain-containing protein, partial [Ginsengibacter sp.]